MAINILQRSLKQAKALTTFLSLSHWYSLENDTPREGIKKVTKEELLRRADIVDLHMRVSDKTYHMIGREELEMMKDTAILVNTARSRLVDTDALVDALKNGKIMGAALDVFDEEPLDPASPLLELDNVTLTTHQGGVTVNAFDDSPAMLLHEIERFFSGEAPRFLQNPSVLNK
mgnify:CR=1 FL=1